MGEDKSLHLDNSSIGRLLTALSEQLGKRGARFDLVLIGGSALSVLGFVDRTTKDVDVLGLLSDRGVVSLKVMPEALEVVDGVTA